MIQGPSSASEPRAAASLILLRDSTTGPEILLLKRHGLSDAFGEAFVFPGGKLDAADACFDTSLLDESPDSLQRRLAEETCDSTTAAGLFVAAIREACEECGVLLAHVHDPSIGESVRSRLRIGDSFAGSIAALGVSLAVSELVPWSRWITPVGVRVKRFDARFFIARAPRGVIGRHDGRETTESVWLCPRAALQRYVDNAIQLAPTQIMTLNHLARFPDVAAALEEAARRPPFLVQPAVHVTSTATLLCFPGDVFHPVSHRAMPGPTRLAIRDKRYIPEAGLDVLLS